MANRHSRKSIKLFGRLIGAENVEDLQRTKSGLHILVMKIGIRLENIESSSLENKQNNFLQKLSFISTNKIVTNIVAPYSTKTFKI